MVCASAYGDDSPLETSQLSLSLKPIDQRATDRRIVFCDFDGPIVNVSERYYNTYRQALRYVASISRAELDPTQPHGRSLHYLSKHQFWQMKCNRIPDADIAARSGLQGEQIDRFLERVQEIVNQPNLLDQDHLQPGVRCALELLRLHHVRLVLVTLRRQDQATQLLAHYHLLHFFEGVWGTHDDESAYVNSSQQKVQLLGQAIAHHCAADEARYLRWMIGDTEADILAGQAHRISTMALTCGIRSEAYLTKFQPTCIHEDLLSVAHDIVASEKVISLVQ